MELLSFSFRIAHFTIEYTHGQVTVNSFTKENKKELRKKNSFSVSLYYQAYKVSQWYAVRSNAANICIVGRIHCERCAPIKIHHYQPKCCILIKLNFVCPSLGRCVVAYYIMHFIQLLHYLGNGMQANKMYSFQPYVHGASTRVIQPNSLLCIL